MQVVPSIAHWATKDCRASVSVCLEKMINERAYGLQSDLRPFIVIRSGYVFMKFRDCGMNSGQETIIHPGLFL